MSTTKITEELKRQIQAAIPAYCEKKSITQAELAETTQLNDAYVSCMVTGNWKNIPVKAWKVMWDLVKPQNTGVYTTTDYETVMNACDSARKYNFMIGITADTGMGKTVGLKAYAGDNPNSYYCYLDKTFTSRILLKNLLQQMGVQFEGSLNAMLARVEKECIQKGNVLFLFDECGKMSTDVMLLIHSLRDRTMQYGGIIVAGMPEWFNRLQRLVERGTIGYGEFFRRVNLWETLDGLSDEEIDFILDDNGITDKKQFRNLTKFGDLGNAIKKYLIANAA